MDVTDHDHLAEHLSNDVDQGFAALLDAHGAMVLTLATRLTDATTGQDITQDVFLRAYRALSGYSPTRIRGLNLRPWLATITRNLVRNEYRRRNRKPTVPLNEESGAHTMTQDDWPVALVDAQSSVNALLSTLSEPQREAVVLRHIVGLPLHQVALTMACPIGTAKSHVSRGVSHLRDVVTAAASNAATTTIPSTTPSTMSTMPTSPTEGESR